VVVSLRQQATEKGKATVSTRTGPQQIVGRVKDAATGAPIASAQVVAHGTPFNATAAQSGAFVIDSVAQGTYSLEARMTGYEPVVFYGARVDSGRTTAVEFSLQSSSGAPEVMVNGVEAEGVRREAPTDARIQPRGAMASTGLVRQMGQVRVEISGLLSPDSLRKLLAKVRPIR
jgi:carboxypeptidase family protein